MTHEVSKIRPAALRLGVVILAIVVGMLLQQSFFSAGSASTTSVQTDVDATELRNKVVVAAQADAPLPDIDTLADEQGMKNVCETADDVDVCRAAVQLFALGAHRLDPFAADVDGPACSSNGSGRIENFRLRYTRDESCMPHIVSVAVPVQGGEAGNNDQVRIARFRLIDPVNNEPRFTAEWGLGYDGEVKKAFLDAVKTHYENRVEEDNTRVQRVEKALDLPDMGSATTGNDSVGNQ